jgi:apolipoprotein N-acyltransferase
MPIMPVWPRRQARTIAVVCVGLMVVFAALGFHWVGTQESVPAILAFLMVGALVGFVAMGLFSAFSPSLPKWWTRDLRRRR